MNGDARRLDPASSSSSNDGQDLEEDDDRRALRELLSQMTQPKVRNPGRDTQPSTSTSDGYNTRCFQVSNVNARSALIELSPPEYNQSEFEICPTEFNYELALSEKGPEGKYKSVYK